VLPLVRESVALNRSKRPPRERARQATFLGRTEPRAARPLGASPLNRYPTAPVRRAIVVAMLHDLVTALLVAFAAVTASELLSRIWGYF
jgi:hypothetical protein